MNPLARRKSSFTVPVKNDVSLSQLLSRNDSQSQGPGFLIPDALSQPFGNLRREGDVTLSQAISKRPFHKFAAPILNTEMLDKADDSEYSQRDLSLSQMLASPPRRSQPLTLRDKDDFAQDENFKTPVMQNQNSKKSFRPPVFQGESKNSQVPARKLVFPPSDKHLSKSELFKTDFSFDNVPQAQPFIIKEKSRHASKSNFDSNMSKTVLRENHQPNSNLASPASRRPLFQSRKNAMFDSVPEAPSISADMFHDASKNLSDFSVSQAIKTQHNKPTYDSEDYGTGPSTQMSLFENFEERERGNEIMNKTPARYKCQNNENIYTPALLQLPGNVAKLRSVEEISSEYQDIFEFPYFNIIQSMVFDDVYYTDKSMIVSAPTGSGKTVIFELAIVRLLFNLHLHHNGKIIYMAPIKALCTERFNDWNEKLGTHGIRCKELTGDTESDDFQELQDANLILTTPEKWDSMSRKWKDNKTLFHTISLFLVDEIHILNDSNRGATVEAVLSRMKTLIICDKNSDKIPMRFVAVSATIPNIQDLAEWLGRSNVSALSFKLDEKYRPVKLQKIVLGYHHKDGESEFKFDINLTYKLKNIIDTYSNGRPTLVFCSSRKMVNQTADVLIKQNHNRSYARREDKDLLKQESLKLRESKVSDFISCGIGVHHAGMDSQDRHSIEELFRQGVLPILVATSTLAMGVNLPAHLVILKSTTFYNMGCPTEYPDTQILQMIGRAGRPQFDSTATAVIMTKTSSKLKYESVVHGTQTIESSLHKNLIEHINAEIVLHTITDMALAVEWIRHTFLYIRIMKNPGHYGVPRGLDKKQVEKQLEELCLKSVNSLAALNLVKLNEETLEIESTETGRLMARYCIAFHTMTKFHDIKGDETLEQLLTLTTNCQEFQDVTLRQTEKTTLNQLNKDKHKECIRYPMPGKIKNKQMKVNCLLQASFGCLPIHDYSLTNDVSKIFRVGQRVVKCLLEFLWQRKEYKALISAIQLSKCFKQRLWEDSKYVTKQLEKIGTTISLALATAGLTTFHKLSETNPREIELIANRHPPFGNQVKEAVASLPKYELAIEQVKNYKSSSAELIISINLMNRNDLLSKPRHYHQAYFIIGDIDNNIVFKWRIVDSVILREDGWRRKIEVKRCPNGSNLYVHLLSQDWVGVDINTVYVPVYLNDVHYNSSHHQLRHKDRPRQTPEVSHSDTALTVCAHKCVNKMMCGHKCCKDGVANKRPARAPKIPTKNRLNEQGLGAQIKNLQNRVQDFPSAPSDLKRPRLNSTVNGAATPGIKGPGTQGLNLTRFAYDKHKGNLSYPVPTSTEEVYDDREGNIEVEDGWQRLNQHQQLQQVRIQQQQQFNQGNFNMELSPIVEDEISYSPLETRSNCSIEDFDNPPEQHNPAPIINNDMVTYWDPGFSSDDEVEMLEDGQIQMKSIIIGKAAGQSESQNNGGSLMMSKSSSVNKDGCYDADVNSRGSESHVTNAQCPTGVDNHHANWKSTHYQRTNKNCRSKFDMNNHYSNLDSDSDDETMATLNYETDHLPEVTFTGRRGHNSVDHSNSRNILNSTNQNNLSTNTSDWFKQANQRLLEHDDLGNNTYWNSNDDEQTSKSKQCFTSFENGEIPDQAINRTSNQNQASDSNDFRNKINNKMNELKNSRQLFSVDGDKTSNVRKFQDLQKEIQQKKKGIVLEDEIYSQVISPISESPVGHRMSQHFVGTSEPSVNHQTLPQDKCDSSIVNHNGHSNHQHRIKSTNGPVEASEINQIRNNQTEHEGQTRCEFKNGGRSSTEGNNFGMNINQSLNRSLRNNQDGVTNSSRERFENRHHLSDLGNEKGTSNIRSELNLNDEQRHSSEQAFKMVQENKMENSLPNPVPIFKKGSHHTQHEWKKENTKPKFNLKSINYTYSSDDTRQLSRNLLVNQDRMLHRPDHNIEDIRQNTQRFHNTQSTNNNVNNQRSTNNEVILHRGREEFQHNFEQFSDRSSGNHDNSHANIRQAEIQQDQEKFQPIQDSDEIHKKKIDPSLMCDRLQTSMMRNHQREVTNETSEANQRCPFLDTSQQRKCYQDSRQSSQSKSLTNQKTSFESKRDFESPPRNVEHRYGQVLAWIPEDSTSPRPTTLPLKSPVPPLYLSQSPPINTRLTEVKNNQSISDKQFGLTNFFCPVSRNEEIGNEEENFNSLFEGIF